MSYAEALEAAGAKIIEFQEFGSYQGDWFALVEYEDHLGWIQGAYGSCSGCDAFQAEFDYGDTPSKVGEKYYSYDLGEYLIATEEDIAAAFNKLKAFGEQYLGGIMSQQEAEAYAERNLDWDSDAEVMVDFIKKHSYLKRIN